MTLDNPDAWADVLAVLAECLREPDEELVAAIQQGELGDAITDAAETLDIEPESGTTPPPVDSGGPLTESYLALFQAMETPYAPNAESPYKPWYGGRSGLMGGPPAEDMTRRYDAVDAELPEGYPPDHVSLLCEYGTLLLDAGVDEEFAAFVDAHFDWFPALALATEGAAAEAPFHRWAVALLDDVTTVMRSRLDLDPVDGNQARAMIDGIGDARPPSPAP
jgi:TorA maturation chaperone TorD